MDVDDLRSALDDLEKADHYLIVTVREDAEEDITVYNFHYSKMMVVPFLCDRAQDNVRKLLGTGER